MKTVWLMAIKDLRLMRRDWLGLFFIIGFPILMGVLFGIIAGSFSTESVSMALAVVDEDQSEMSQKFVGALKANDNMDIHEMDRASAIEQVRRGDLVGLIALPKEFGETAGVFWAEGPAIQVGVDPSRKAESGMINGLVMQAMGELVTARFQDPAGMRSFVTQSRDQLANDESIPLATRTILRAAMGSLDAFMEKMAEVPQDGEGPTEGMPSMDLAQIETIDVTRKAATTSSGTDLSKLQSKWDISFPQAMLWGVLGCVAGFAISIVRERKLGTFLRLQIAPIRRGQILAGKALACAMTVIGVIVFMTTLGVLLGMRPGNYLMLAVASLCVAYCFVGIMMLMSVIGKSEEAVSGAAWGANILMAMFGGGMFPLAFMPPFMKTISHADPVKWGILALEGAIWRDFGWSEIAVPALVLLGFGTVGLVAGIFVLSRNS